jgi:hypothetical protein
MMRATDIVTRLDLKRYPRSWRGRCLCCDYTGNTFSIGAGKAGWARLFCANGCARDDLVAAVAQATGQPPPARPMVDRDGTVIRDQGSGKVRYQRLISFATARVRDRWSDAVIEAVRAKHPEAFK